MKNRPWRLSVLTLAALLAACATPQSAAPPEPDVLDVAGVYDGSFDVDGQAISGTLELQQDGTELTGTFDSPMGVSAEGAGTLDGDRIRMEFDYTMQCPGTARMEGRVRGEGNRISGTFTASDCTGGGTGTFSFVRG